MTVTPSEESPPAPYRSGFGRLAGRISGWTSNLLATAVIIVVALGAGQGLVSMWGVDSPEDKSSQEATSLLSWVDPSESCLLEFGDAPLALERAIVHGDLEQALASLRQRCKSAVTKTAIPGQEPGKAERRLLERVKTWKPVEHKPGVWRLYQVKDVVPMVVGFRDDIPAASNAKSSRMVVWGLAVPKEEGEWTLFLCHSTSRAGSVTAGAAIPLPRASQRILAISDDAGRALIGFRGGEAAALRQHFDAWAAQENWKTVQPWKQEGNSWQVRYAGKVGAAPAAQIHFTVETGGALAGLLSFDPVKGEKASTP